MLTHYFDLKAIPQSDLVETEVVGHIVERIHLELPLFGGRIGIGFPLYGRYRTPGGIVRLFSIENDLTTLHGLLWKKGLDDYALFGNVQAIPAVKRYAIFKRFRPVEQSDINRAKRRWAAQGLSENEITQRMNQWLDKPTRTYPHLFLKSRSTQQRMVLHIRRVETVKAQTGTFSNYGLSTEATVPIF